MTPDITPADVYALVNSLAWGVFGLAALVGLQIAAKVLLFARVLRVLRRVESLLRVADAYLGMTGRQQADVVSAVGRVGKMVAATAARVAAEDVKSCVAQVPDATVEKMRSAPPVEGGGS